MPELQETGNPTRREFRVVVLAGDGIGPEVTEQAIRVLGALESAGMLQTTDHEPVHIELDRRAFGGHAVDACGEPLPAATWKACRSADAVLLGAAGGPRWDTLEPLRRPEAGLLELRKRLGTFANLRPIRRWIPAGAPWSGRDIDLLVVRELTGGIYFGEPRGTVIEPGGTLRAYDTLLYSEGEVERLARRGFEAARRRGGRVTSVDKANVLESSRLWRATVDRVARDFPDVSVDHQLVDSFTIRMVQRPETIDVVVTGNLFGDILSDLGGAIVGTIGVLPSASLGDGSLPGIFEPVHGSAPDIAGQGRANPLGMILAAAMMLRHGLGLEDGARAIEQAVQTILRRGLRTADMAGPDRNVVDTARMGEAIADAIEEAAAGSLAPKAKPVPPRLLPNDQIPWR